MKYLIVLLLGGCYLIVNSLVLSKNDETLIIQDDILELIKAPTKKIASINYELAFWQEKVDVDKKQLTYKHKLALSYYDRFQAQGNISDLDKSNSILEEIVLESNETSSIFLRSMARIYITQHEFQKAHDAISKALQNGDKRRASECILFDIQMELGYYNDAKETLQKIYHLNDFDYLIRKAKFEDYLGNLDSAIKNLEKALTISLTTKNESQQIWLYSNLGDFYTHDDQPIKALEYYKKTLKLDDSNYYAFKSIAWLAFAKNQNTDLAISIVNGIIPFYKSADLHLFLAELSEFKKDEAGKLLHIQQFMNKSKSHSMYRIPQSLILAEEYNDFDSALNLALMEIQSRNTPETQENLAWIYFLRGDINKALKIIDTNVYNKTYEPTALFHAAIVFKHHNKNNLTQTIKADLLNTGLELGPLMMKEIEKL